MARWLSRTEVRNKKEARFRAAYSPPGSGQVRSRVGRGGTRGTVLTFLAVPSPAICTPRDRARRLCLLGPRGAKIPLHVETETSPEENTVRVVPRLTPLPHRPRARRKVKRLTLRTLSGALCLWIRTLLAAYPQKTSRLLY